MSVLLCPWDSPGENTEVGCHFHPSNIAVTTYQMLSMYLCEVFYTVYLNP